MSGFAIRRDPSYDDRYLLDGGHVFVDHFEVTDLEPYQKVIDADIKALAALFVDEPVGYDSFGAPLYAHQLPPEGTE